MNFSGQSNIYSRKYRLRKAPAASSVSHKEIHGAGYKGKGHYRGDRFQMGCQERFQGVTGEKPDQIGTGTGQKKPGGHREQVYEAVGVWQDKEGIAAEIEEKDFGVGELDYEAAQEGGPGIFTVRKASPVGFPGKVEDIGHCYVFDIRDVGGEGNPGCVGYGCGNQCSGDEAAQESEPHCHRVPYAVLDRTGHRIQVCRARGVGGGKDG